MANAPGSWKHAAEQLPLVNQRQREVLDLIERGHTNQEIADRLGISLAGAKWHVSELLGKLGLSSREEMAEFWAWRSSRGQRFAKLAVAAAALRARSLEWAVITAAAVAISVPLLLLRGGSSGEADVSPTTVGEISPGPLAAASLSPSRGLRMYARPLPAKGPEGRLAYIDPAGNLVVQPMPAGASKVVRDSANQRSPRWSASGNYLAVVESGALLVFDDQGAGPNLAEMDRDSTWAWSPAEDVLAFYVREGMFLYDARTRVKKTLRGQGAPLPEQPGSVIWSPDGTRILYGFSGNFTTIAGSTTSEMRIFDLSSGEDRLLIEQDTPPQGGTAPLGWSGDGEWVFYREAPFYGASVWADGVPLYTMPATGGLSTKLGTNLGRDDLFSARPGEPTAAYVEGGWRAAYQLVRRIELVRGADRIPLAGAAPGSHSAVAWSPEGGRLTYIAMPEPPPNVAGGQAALDVLMGRKLWVQTPGGPAIQLTDDPAYRDEHPVWSADGESILFTRIDAAAKASVWRVDAVGGTPERVVDALGMGQGGPLDFYGWLEWGQLLDWSQR